MVNNLTRFPLAASKPLKQQGGQKHSNETLLAVMFVHNMNISSDCDFDIELLIIVTHNPEEVFWYNLALTDFFFFSFLNSEVA